MGGVRVEEESEDAMRGILWPAQRSMQKQTTAANTKHRKAEEARRGDGRVGARRVFMSWSPSGRRPY